MKINSINNSQRLQQQPQNFKGGFVDFVAKNPELITGLAGASVIAQKVVAKIPQFYDEMKVLLNAFKGVNNA